MVRRSFLEQIFTLGSCADYSELTVLKITELDDSVAVSDTLTSTMIAEEEEMKKKAEDDQERLLQEHEQVRHIYCNNS